MFGRNLNINKKVDLYWNNIGGEIRIGNENKKEEFFIVKQDLNFTADKFIYGRGRTSDYFHVNLKKGDILIKIKRLDIDELYKYDIENKKILPLDNESKDYRGFYAYSAGGLCLLGQYKEIIKIIKPISEQQIKNLLKKRKNKEIKEVKKYLTNIEKKILKIKNNPQNYINNIKILQEINQNFKDILNNTSKEEQNLETNFKTF